MLIRSVKNSAWALLVIFLFPIIFQPVHMLWHRTHGADSVCQVDGHCHSCADAHSHGVRLTPEKHHCLICSFEFSINEMPEHAVLVAYCSVLEGVLHDNPCLDFIPAALEEAASRAPPHHFA